MNCEEVSSQCLAACPSLPSRVKLFSFEAFYRPALVANETVHQDP